MRLGRGRCENASHYPPGIHLNEKATGLLRADVQQWRQPRVVLVETVTSESESLFVEWRFVCKEQEKEGHVKREFAESETLGS